MESKTVFHRSAQVSSHKIAVLLCGSGFRDGSEIRESVAALWALSRLKVESVCFAPNDLQYDVVNCLTLDSVCAESRNMLVESARIARGQVQPLEKLSSDEFDGLIIPGGFGVAKNLCSFAMQGASAQVRKDVSAVLEGFFSQQKPIGAICIAPALIGLSLKSKASLELTLGSDGEAAQEIEKMGHKHIVRQAHEFHWDQKNHIFSTPAYMYEDGTLADIFEGIYSMTEALVRSFM